MRYKIELEAKYGYMYKRNRQIKLRFYGATAFDNRPKRTDDGSIPAIHLISDINSDYSYEDFYFHRKPENTVSSESPPENPFSGGQVNTNRGGGFHNPSTNSGGLGESTSFGIALNLTGDLPFRGINLPIKPYLDLGVYQAGLTETDQEVKFLATGGIAIELMDAFGLYIPLVQSNDFKFRGNFINRIGFKVDLHRANVLNYRGGLRL